MEYTDIVEKFMHEGGHYEIDESETYQNWICIEVEEFAFYEKGNGTSFPYIVMLNKNTNEMKYFDCMKGGIYDVKIVKTDKGRFFKIKGRFLGQVLGYYTFDINLNLVSS